MQQPEFQGGDPRKTRTSGLRFRKPPLYPAELWGLPLAGMPPPGRFRKAGFVRNKLKAELGALLHRLAASGVCKGMKLGIFTALFVLMAVARGFLLHGEPMPDRHAEAKIPAAPGYAWKG